MVDNAIYLVCSLDSIQNVEIVTSSREFKSKLLVEVERFVFHNFFTRCLWINNKYCRWIGDREQGVERAVR